MLISTVVDNDIIQHLMYTGLSEYEARAYLALVSSKSPVTPYELARLSGISTSKVYETVARLEERRMARDVSGPDGGKKRYVAQPPQDYIDTSRKTMDLTLKTLGHGLASVVSEDRPTAIWNIHGYDELFEKAARTIQSARLELLVSVWAEDVDRLIDPMKEAMERGVRIAMLHYGMPKERVGQVYMHPIDVPGERRTMSVVADSIEAVVCTIMQGGRAEGAFSDNPGFVMMAEEYIKHDIYMMKVVSRFDRELRFRFGPKYTMLTDVFTDMDTM